MQFVRCSLLLALSIVVAGLLSPAIVSAQPAGTPAAATPVASDALAGRLGGSLDDVVDRFGQPDFTADGLVRYDAADIGGTSTILVVYVDSNDQVVRMAMVYPVRPQTLATPVDISTAAAAVAPLDGACEDTAISTGYGAEVYPCRSEALAGAVSAEQLEALGVAGEPGDYSVAVDPLPDTYFEILVQFGADGASLLPTAAAGEPTPTATPTLDERYPPLDRPADLMDGDVPRGEPLSFSGSIVTLQIADDGMKFRLGEDDSLWVGALFQVRLDTTGRDDVVLFVGYDGDASDLGIGDRVTVYGTNYGTQCFDNALGDEVCQPLIAADIVDAE